MQLLKKQKEKKRERTIQKAQRLTALIICIVAPIATYLISPTKVADEDFMSTLAWILILSAAVVFAVEKGPAWWLLLCFYTAFWHVMLVGVPSFGLANLLEANYGEGLIWYFFVIFCLTMILSGAIGIVLKIIIRISKP